MPNTDSKTYIVNDQPTETDALDFMPYVETLADIIQTGNTPLTIGVFGTWGSGKTSLMRMVKQQLPSDFTIAWFDAWKYDKEETLWRAFLLNILFAIEEKSGETEYLKTLKTILYRGLEFEKTGGVTIDLARLGAKVAVGAIQIGLSFIPPLSALANMARELQKSGKENIEGGFENAIQRERTKIYIEQVRSLEQFQEKFAILIKSYIAPKRLVVFIDDLDRCLPEKAIEVLEAIKLFLDAQNCIFVLGLDQEIIARGIEMKYRELGVKQGDKQQSLTIEGIKYLEKIIQLPFQIPPVESADIEDFVKSLNHKWPSPEIPRILAVGLGDNPRQIKRTINVFFMLWKLAEKRKAKLEGRIKPLRLAKLVIIQEIYPELYKLLKRNPENLRELEEYYRSIEENEENLSIEIPKSLKNYVEREEIRNILTYHSLDMNDANFSGLSHDELFLYFTLTRRAESIDDTRDFDAPELESRAVQIEWQKTLNELEEERKTKQRSLSKETEALPGTLKIRRSTGGRQRNY